MAMLPEKESVLAKLFRSPKPLIGTIHCLPFPGAPRYRGEKIDAIVAHAVSEAKAYEEGGLDGIIVENAWDLPFLRPEDIWYETVATLSVVTKCVREASSLPIGVNLLANAGEAAIAVLAHGLGPVGLDSIMALVVPENVGSWRVMEKVGMRYQGLADYYGLKGLKKYVAERGWWSSPLVP